MDYFATRITGVILYGLPIFLYLPLGILAQKRIGGGYSDPARNGFNWFKAALWLTFSHLVFFVITIIVTVTAQDDGIPILHLDGITSLLLNFSIYVLLLSIAYLAAGADRVDNQHDSTRTMSCIFINIVRAILGVCGILTIVSFIFFRYLDAKRFDDYGYSGISTSDRRAARAFSWIWLAIDAFQVIVAIYTTVFSCMARNQARQYAASAGTGLPVMRRVWDFLVPAAGITIVTTVWTLAYDVIGSAGILLSYNSRGSTSMVRGSLMIIDVIISKWVVLAVCAIVYRVGTKKETGLWSIPPTESVEPEKARNKDEEGHYSV
ncbi:hypothetical protein V8F33_011275 [Rhypophila sp. PSN 637]